MSSRCSAIRPGRPLLGRHANRDELRVTRSRCQRSRVWGLTRKRTRSGGQALAETGEQEAISRPPARPLHLGLEDAELVPEDQELQPEVGVRVMSIDQGLEE